MTIEEMKRELQKAGYSIHERMDDKRLKRRSDLYWEIQNYISNRRYWLYQKTGKYVELYCIKEWSQACVRKKMKQKYGSIDYSLIPDEEWPAAKKELFFEAKRYINRRYEKEEAGL